MYGTLSTIEREDNASYLSNRAPNYRDDNPEARTGVWDSPGFARYLSRGDRQATAIYHEAIIENERRDAQATPEDRTATGRAMAALRRREVDLTREVDNLRDEVTRLRTEQIKGHDPRLREFWEEAQAAADRADYCEVFDRLADELGGPRRTVDVEVTVSISHTFTARLSRSDYALDDYRSIDPSDYIDRYSIDLSNVEIEEVTEV